jgi:hypothetical protein
MTKLRFAIAMGAWAVTAVACASGPPNHRPALAEDLAAMVSPLEDGAHVDLAEVATFEWDVVYGFPAYTVDEDVAATIGLPWGTNSVSRLPSESLVLLIFATADEVTGWAVLNRSPDNDEPIVEFDRGVYRIPIARTAARFEVGWSDRSTSDGVRVAVLRCAAP